MCGITGILSFNVVGRMQLVHLEQATRSLEKRGPDHHGSWFDESVGLGHRRLSIIDVSPEANQPFWDASGRYAIIYNGEVYNYQELRARLKAGGVNFRTTCDTEVVLQAYMTWGEEAVRKFNGFFAFAIYDTHRKSLFLARDRFGIKPLLYYQDDDKFIFASEMKSLLAYGIPKVIDQTSLHQYFQLTYVPDNQSMLDGVKKLQPGHCGHVIEGEATFSPYYAINPQNDVAITFEKAKEQIIEKIRKSVDRRLVSDVPLGAFLSGGIDSSVIVALASERVSDLKTFSIGFKDNRYFDETQYANLVAEKFKTDHQVFKLSNDDLLQHVGDIVDYIDEPFADSSSIPVYILSQLTKEKVTVALSGDGADEVFSGYNKHAAWDMSYQQSSFNRMVQLGRWFWKYLPKSRYVKLTDRFRQLDRYASILKLSPAEKYWFLAAFIREEQVAKMLANPVSPALIEDRFKSLTLGISPDLNTMLARDVSIVLPGDMLRKVDLMSMANALEVRVPFLDHEVVDFAFSLPAEFKVQGKNRKILLREAFRQILPEELYSRPKHGFEVPIMSWFKKELKLELSRYVFDRDRIEAQGIFRWQEISKIRRRLHSMDPADVHIKIWSMYVFQKWYERYIGS
ncbi:MAG: asparagine synthase (glutamine-hydrolyzing) [Cytophagales bacterium]|nr:asparagine synthase (glutamine-hydrolyzing) [Cytophagales bacterium]